MQLLTITLIGLLLGRISAGWAAFLLADMNSGGLITCAGCQQPVSRSRRWWSLRTVLCSCSDATPIRWHIGSAIGLGAGFLLFSWLLLSFRCESVDEVQPASALLVSRLPFHLTLIFLLWVATLTDFLDYVIPDEIIYLGTALAVLAAFASGDLQMIHIWVNWDKAIPGIAGPELPEWMKTHRHLHGLAWSLAGMTCGALLTWLVRWLSQRILGYPALGFGDVMLMGLIGAFLGWQPTLCVLAIAPLTSIIVGLFVRLFSGRSFIALGPYLACSAFLVMCSWRWLWADYLKLRDIFSHWPTVVGLVCFAFITLTILLLLLRLFRTLPAEALRR